MFWLQLFPVCLSLSIHFPETHIEATIFNGFQTSRPLCLDIYVVFSISAITVFDKYSYMFLRSWFLIISLG